MSTDSCQLMFVQSENTQRRQIKTLLKQFMAVWNLKSWLCPLARYWPFRSLQTQSIVLYSRSYSDMIYSCIHKLGGIEINFSLTVIIFHCVELKSNFPEKMLNFPDSTQKANEQIELQPFLSYLTQN